MPQALMFGTTLAVRVLHYWQLPSILHPLDVSSGTFIHMGTRLWTIQQASLVDWRQHRLHPPCRRDLLTTVLLCNQHLQLHQRHLHPNQKPKPEAKRGGARGKGTHSNNIMFQWD